MNKAKRAYACPTSDLLVVRFEQELLTVSGGVNYSDTPGGAGGNDGYDDGEGF